MTKQKLPRYSVTPGTVGLLAALKVSVSKGNTKLGKILNISLPPIKTCRKNAPCAGGCYANNHAYRLYPGVRAAWDGNLKVYKAMPDWYFHQIYLAVQRHKTFKLCRWHVGGDIPDFDYLVGMVTVAEALPDVLFLCFTKQYEIVEEYETFRKFPKNLNVVFSAWPGLELPKGASKRRPIAWMRDCRGPDPRIPAKALECPGTCDKCGICFRLKPGQSSVFDKH